MVREEKQWEASQADTPENLSKPLFLTTMFIWRKREFVKGGDFEIISFNTLLGD